MIEKKQLEIEQDRLCHVSEILTNEISFLDQNVKQSQGNLKEMSEFLADHFYEMDDEENAVQKNLFEKIQLDLKDLKILLHKKQNHIKSPYFGRFDFKADDEENGKQYYVATNYLINTGYENMHILDWRAPICSMFYANSTGRAEYDAPQGKIAGEISLKRQFKTDHKKLVYAFDSSAMIGDEILRQALGKNSTLEMHNIVETIQAEQNQIIRADAYKTLLVQGVAGSGKTSIALHRVAYLMYNNHYKAEDMLLISPSSLFGNYVKNVLPELGEQNIQSATFEEIARSELEGYATFSSRNQMIEDILQGNQTRAHEVNYKANFEFYESLKTFLNQIVNLNFKAQDVVLGKQKIPAAEIEKLYNERYKNKLPSTKINWIADYVIDQFGIEKRFEQEIFERIKKVLLSMFEVQNILDIYSAFLVAIGMNCGVVGFEDVPALLYIKHYLIGLTPNKNFKHIIVDEMQDLSPIALEILDVIFPTTKTILGDIYQCLDKKLDENYLQKLAKQLNANLVKLTKTYRSTSQIFEYAEKLINLEGVTHFNRQGEAVEEIKIDQNFAINLEKTVKNLQEKYNSIAIITNTIAESLRINKILNGSVAAGLIGESVGSLAPGVNIIPCVFAKGLEFDAVVYISSGEKTQTGFVACTRSLHNLVVFN